jgi:peptidoglycan/LPS O-acetylase OafA/YrhL
MIQLPTSAVRPARGPGTLHLAHVEGLRALAAYVVFVNHAYAQAFRGGLAVPPWYLAPFTFSMIAGHLSVAVFIVISGFCLMLPVVRAGGHLRGGTAGFLKRRARRILPPYYGSVALCLALIWTIIGKPTGTLWDFPIVVSTEAVISHVFLLQDFFATSRINYVFWSIAVEWQIYFLFPILVFCWRRFGPRATVTTAMVVGYALRVGLADTRVARGAPHFLGLFTLGMLAAYVVQRDDPGAARARDRFPWGGVAIACAAVVGVLGGLWGWQTSQDRFHWLDFPAGIAAMCILVIASRGDGFLKRVLSLKPLVFIGTFSYSVYLIHAPLLQIIWQYALNPLHLERVPMFAALMVPGALAILGAAYAFFRVFEEPFMKQPAAPPAAAAVPPAAAPSNDLPPAALR